MGDVLPVTVCSAPNQTLSLLDQMVADGVIQRYAIGGAVAAAFYVEPTQTFDLTVFFVFPATPTGLISISPIYRYLMQRGYQPEGEGIQVDGDHCPPRFDLQGAGISAPVSERRRVGSTRMDEKSYPDIAPFLAAKAAQRRQLAARSWEEKVAIIEQMRESMPRPAWRKVQSAPEAAAGRRDRYRAIIEKLLEAYAQSAPQGDATDERRACQPIFDERQDIYLVQCLRWEHGRRLFTTPVRLRIEDDRMVIEADESQGGMVAALTQAGIPADDVVERATAACAGGSSR